MQRKKGPAGVAVFQGLLAFQFLRFRSKDALIKCGVREWAREWVDRDEREEVVARCVLRGVRARVMAWFTFSRWVQGSRNMQERR